MEEHYNDTFQERLDRNIAQYIDRSTPSSRLIKRIITFMVLIIVVVALIIGWNIKSASDEESSEEQNFHTVLTKLENEEQNIYVIADKADIPSSTTMTKDQWDKFYGDIKDQLDSELTSIQSVDLVSTDLSQKQRDNLRTYQYGLEQFDTQLANYVVLDQSTVDLSFTIDDDKSSVQSDQSNSYTDKSQLTQDQTQLATDQSNETAQQKQLSQLEKQNATLYNQLVQMDQKLRSK